MLKLLASKHMHPYLSYVATLPEKTLTTQNERFCMLHVVFL